MRWCHGNVFCITGHSWGHHWIPLTMRPMMQSFDVLFFHRIAHNRKTCAMCNICSNHTINWKFKSEQTEISVKYASQWYKIKSLSFWKQNILGMLWIPWLLMPWLLVSPGHQHTWYCIYRINRSLRLPLRDFNCLHHTSVEKRSKMHIYFSCLQKLIQD